MSPAVQVGLMLYGLGAVSFAVGLGRRGKGAWKRGLTGLLWPLVVWVKAWRWLGLSRPVEVPLWLMLWLMLVLGLFMDGLTGGG